MENAQPTRAELVAQIVSEAAHLPSQEQATILQMRCGSDEELRAVVDYLLKPPEVGLTHTLADSAVVNAESGFSRDSSQVDLEHPRQIGRYKLLQPIGEGGFGSVFKAEQEYPIRRVVALKIIKPGMDTRQVIARFEAERQALAMMDHPNIAKVFDAGSTEGGRPYFVMELVRGIPINEYCDKHNVSVCERLELFVAACQAVQHAHQKGIIHRDIKPGNVLITLHDGRPIPKVIDFGIAKATQAKLTDKTLVTEFRQVMGTPEYMSPEQAEMSSLDVDTRADIYSLGVVLYELLTGTTPFEGEGLRSKPYAQIERIIRDVDPPRPSTRIAGLGERLNDIATRRGSDARRLSGLVRGELDWIVMRCLEKDRTRRYETADALALDVRNHLQGRPVLACPPSKLYLFRKFSQRNRSTLAVAAALVLMLISTTIAAVYYGIKERTLSLQQEGQIAERNASIESQNRFIAKQERIQGETNAQLYNAYLEESSALRLARKPGYRKVVFENLHKAAALKSPAKNLDQIAAEALACLGDPIGLGLEPIPSTAAVPKSRPGIPNHFRSSQNLQHATASADGEWLAGIGPGGRIVLRQRGLDRPVKVMPVPLGGITYDMEFSPDGQHLALGCEEGAAVLSVPALTQAAFFRGDKALSVAFHPRGRLVAFTGRTISLCGIPSNRLIASFVADSAANTVMFSADEQLLLASNSRTPERILYAWPIGDTPERTNLLGHDRGILDLAYSPDGAQLTSVGRDNLLRIWNSATGALLHTCSGHESPVGCLAYHPAGNSLVSGDENGTILCWDAKTGQKLRSIPALSGQRLLRLAFDAGGNYLVAAGDGGLAAWAINRTDQKVTAENFLWLERAGIVNDMVIHPDGMHIVFLEAPGVGRRPIAPPEQQIREAGAMVFSYDLSAMAYPDILLDKPAWPQNVSLHFDPAGKILRFATPRQILAALSWPSALPITDFPEFEVSISTRSQDGRWLASIVQGKGVVIYDLESKVRWATLPMGEPQVWSLEFSPDGTRLAIGYTLGGLAIWDLTLVRATFAEFGVNVPSTAAKVPAPPRPQPLSAAAFAQILDRHRQAAKSAPPAIPQ